MRTDGCRGTTPLLLALLLLLAPVVALAGCVADDTPDIDSPRPRPETSATAIVYACPAGATTVRGPGVCAGSLTHVESAYGEPDVAIHPTDPDIIAVGVNDRRQLPTWEVDPLAVTGAAVRLSVHVTEDGGRTWQSTPLPHADGAPPVGDPAVAFDSKGRLHVSGLAWDRAGMRVFYTFSDDAGRSWSEAVVVNDHPKDDRNWITVSSDGKRIMIPWQNTQRTSVEVAMSEDGGRTWARAPSIPECNLHTRVILRAGGGVLACFSHTDKMVSVHEVTSRSTARLSLVPGPPFPTGTLHMDETRDGVIVLGYPGWNVKAGLARSGDGGRTWTRPVDVLGFVPEAADWTWSWVSAFAVDPWGNAHFIVVGGNGTPCHHGNCEDAAEKRHVVHGVFSIDGSHFGGSARLVPEAANARAREEITLSDASRDDFHGLAFNSERGVIGWTFDKGIDYMFMERG